MDMYGDWMGSTGDAAVASNSSSGGWWDAIISIGGKAVEYGVKKAIDKEFAGDNQQPISTVPVLGASPLNNSLPSRGFASNMPNYLQGMDMQPFLLLGGAFVVVLILVMSFRK